MSLLARLILIRVLAALVPVLLVCAPTAFAQHDAPLAPQPMFEQPELDQMLAPIALYPDALLSQILMASTYPLEIAEAARWARANSGIQGEQAVRAVEQADWDASVKSLVAFPQILTMMEERLNWTQRLGDAFLGQGPQVMDTVQNLRYRAYAAGNLPSTEQMRVEQQGPVFVIEPANPQIIYVPYYDPVVAYGAWWWPTHPPVYWSPWPGYYAHPRVVRGLMWGRGTMISGGFFFGGLDWRQRRVSVNPSHRYHQRAGNGSREWGATPVIRSPNTAPALWTHNPAHRRGVAYRNAAAAERVQRANTSFDARREASAPAATPQAVDTRNDRLRMRGAVTATSPPQTGAPMGSTGAFDNRAAPRDALRDRTGARVDNPFATRPNADGVPQLRSRGANPPDSRDGRGNRSEIRMHTVPDASARPAALARDNVRGNAVGSTVRMNESGVAPGAAIPGARGHPGSERRSGAFGGNAPGVHTGINDERASRRQAIAPASIRASVPPPGNTTAPLPAGFSRIEPLPQPPRHSPGGGESRHQRR